jgi:two-component system chemotaxis response regulator CheB
MVSHGPATTSLPELVVIGCSRGGLSALTEVLHGLPPDFPAAVVIVQHLSPKFDSHLAEILNSRTPLPVVQAKSSVRIVPGHVYVAPADQHLTLNQYARLQLDHSSKVNFSRPAVDRLFRSAATHFGKRAIAVLLSGFGKDGALGAAAIHEHGGIVIVQDEGSSTDFGMAESALLTGCVDATLPVTQIAEYLRRYLKRND